VNLCAECGGRIFWTENNGGVPAIHRTTEGEMMLDLDGIEKRYGQFRSAPTHFVVSARVAAEDTDALVAEVKRLRLAILALAPVDATPADPEG